MNQPRRQAVLNAALPLVNGQAAQADGTPARSVMVIKDNVVNNLSIDVSHYAARNPNLVFPFHPEYYAKMKMLHRYDYYLKVVYFVGSILLLTELERSLTLLPCWTPSIRSVCLRTDMVYFAFETT